MLTLEVEYLTGVCFAAQKQSSDEPDWPPQPDRLFSALVAAWGWRGEPPQEKAALEWLEQQPTPSIAATGYEVRHVGISFVPPNDTTDKPETMPDRRRRQARMFPAAIPHHPVVRFTWSADPGDESFDALQALARDTAYLGHSASVVRCRFTMATAVDPQVLMRTAQRRVYPGRLASLQHSYQIGERPLAGEAIPASPETPQTMLAHSVFSPDWIVLEDAGGQCPDLRAAAIVARRLREALMSRYGDEALPVPEVISGHKADGSPAECPHIAVVPLADVGQSRYSDGRLMGMALVLPREANEERRQAEGHWLAGLSDASGKIAQWRTFDRLLSQVSELKLGGLGVWTVSRTLASPKKALQPARYGQAAKRWCSVTPLVLDRFPKSKTAEARDEEIAATIASSCRNIGLPAPERVRVYKHAAVKGAPSAYPSGNAPSWMGWTLPGFLANRLLTHAVIEFSEPVEGPVIVGAGRFVGLGLFLGEDA
ncbi:MAG TPA: type I-U CRISPR-associated protein Csb2 [Candidatus Sulfotelmatobacter sp.]|nr:type I-U CRISPR-associated protein Csb2 [Candidatus Sulfotelmatobacter sp.]